MRRITVALLLCILWSLAGTEAQTTPLLNINPDSNEDHCDIPFHIVYKLMIIEASINGITGYLYLDTGIDGLVIRDKYFSSVRTENEFRSSTGSRVKAGTAFAAVQFACISMNFQEARVMNLDHLIPNESTRVLGLVGWDVFKGFELMIDFRNKLLCLIELDKHGHKTGTYNHNRLPIQTIPFEFNGSLPFVRVKIGAENLCLILDTGASVNVIRKPLNKRLAPCSRFLRMVELCVWESVFEAPMTEVTGVLLGEIQLEAMNTVWYDMSVLNGSFKGPVIDGIIGQELMKQYLLAINFTTLEIKLYNYDDFQLHVDARKVIEKIPSNED